MLFNSLTFVVFFTVVMLAYWSLSSWSLRKNVLLVASYLFYAAWNPPFVILLAISTVVDYVSGKSIHQANSLGRKRMWLCISLLTNLGFLGFFKYGNFLLENFQMAAAALGIDYQPAAYDIVLPVGISFYTFQTLSYTIDVYRGNAAPTKSWRDFALFVAFFPQLVAGPIVRAVDFLPQCVEPPKPRVGRLGWGLFLMTLGLFQKSVLADTLVSGTAETVFGYGGPIATLDAWMGTLAFTCQIFFDFAGYSTCAIGAAFCLGFSLPDNFRFPYAAVGPADFWRRWHISLSTWLRDYLYIPLGGNRKGTTRTLANLMIVMFLGGLWHGASWNFAIWGALHGTYLIAERGLVHLFGKAGWVKSAPVQVALWLTTFLLICVTWVFFRAGTFDAAMLHIMCMAGQIPVYDAVLSTREILQVSIVTVALLTVHRVMRHTSLERVVASSPRWLVIAVWAVMAFALILNQGNSNAFIYFQF